MRLRAVTFDDEGKPQDFTFALSLKELALISRLAGHHSPQDILDATNNNASAQEAFHDLADGAAFALNHFFDGGVEDVLPEIK